MTMIAVTPWHKQIKDDDICCEAGEVEARDIARGFAGALFVSLPLLFTMEMWQIARTIPETVLLALLGVSFVVNHLLIGYAGYRKQAWQMSQWWDTLTCFGIGVVASTSTLLATGLIGPGMDLYLIVKTIALEAVPTSMGAAVAVNQLGSGDSGREGLSVSPDIAVILGSFLGGFLFAFNVAPTIETKVIVQHQSWILVGITFAMAISVSYLTVTLAQFEERDMSERKIITSEWMEAIISYVIAFIISMILLWTFGYGTPLDPIEVWLPQTVALSYATALGGAAGRLVL